MAYKIDNIDKRLLFELDKNARIPDTQLAKKIRKSKETVRYRIKKLQENNIIQGFSTWIDPTNVGFQSAKIYLRISNKPKEKEILINFLKKDKRLVWLGVAEGAWNIGLTFFVKDNREFYELKNELFSKFNNLILESHTGSLVEVVGCDKKFLYDIETSWKNIFKFSGNYKLDDLEKKILKELFKNSRINIVDIAHNNNLTVDVVRNRIKKLENNKVISRYMAIINYNKLGFDFYKTFLYFKKFNKEDEKKIMEYCRKQKNTIHLIKQISPWDIELELMCKSFQEYNQVISELTKNFSDIIQKVDTAIMGEDHAFPANEMVFE